MEVGFIWRRKTQPVIRNIAWEMPKAGWIKINSDGSMVDDKAASGGVLRDDKGAWLHGYVRNLGSCSVVMAELWGIIDGLSLAWEQGYRRVWIETDSQIA